MTDPPSVILVAEMRQVPRPPGSVLFPFHCVLVTEDNLIIVKITFFKKKFIEVEVT